MPNRKRNKKIYFWVSEEEKEMIDYKLKFSNLPKGMFYRKMIIDGQVIRKDIEREKYKYKIINNLANEIHKIGINVNQIAKYTNQIGSISKNEYMDLEKKIEEIWQILNSRLHEF
jgi:hypothetical protein